MFLTQLSIRFARNWNVFPGYDSWRVPSGCFASCHCRDSTGKKHGSSRCERPYHLDRSSNRSAHKNDSAGVLDHCGLAVALCLLSVSRIAPSDEQNIWPNDKIEQANTYHLARLSGGTDYVAEVTSLAW